MTLKKAKLMTLAKIQMERRHRRKFQFLDGRQEGKTQRVIPGKKNHSVNSIQVGKELTTHV